VRKPNAYAGIPDAVSDEPPDDDFVRKVCRPGQGPVSCRYPTHPEDGWSCERHSKLQKKLDWDAASGAIEAQECNCGGRGSRW